MIEIITKVDIDGNSSCISSNDIRFVVFPCSDYESRQLWRESVDKGIDFISATIGTSYTIDYVLFAGKRLPIDVTPFVHILNGFPIVFIEPFGDAFVRTVAEEWIDCHFLCRQDQGTRRAICDPSNFHQCLNAIAEFEAEHQFIEGILRVESQNDRSSHQVRPLPPLGKLKILP